MILQEIRGSSEWDALLKLSVGCRTEIMKYTITDAITENVGLQRALSSQPVNKSETVIMTVTKPVISRILF